MTKGRPSRGAALQDSITTCRARALMPDRLRTEREAEAETGLARSGTDGADGERAAQREHQIPRPVETEVDVHVRIVSFAMEGVTARVDQKPRRRVGRGR